MLIIRYVFYNRWLLKHCQQERNNDDAAKTSTCSSPWQQSFQANNKYCRLNEQTSSCSLPRTKTCPRKRPRVGFGLLGCLMIKFTLNTKHKYVFCVFSFVLVSFPPPRCRVFTPWSRQNLFVSRLFCVFVGLFVCLSLNTMLRLLLFAAQLFDRWRQLSSEEKNVGRKKCCHWLVAVSGQPSSPYATISLQYAAQIGSGGGGQECV